MRTIKFWSKFLKRKKIKAITDNYFEFNNIHILLREETTQTSYGVTSAVVVLAQPSHLTQPAVSQSQFQSQPLSQFQSQPLGQIQFQPPRLNTQWNTVPAITFMENENILFFQLCEFKQNEKNVTDAVEILLNPYKIPLFIHKNEYKNLISYILVNPSLPSIT